MPWGCLCFLGDSFCLSQLCIQSNFLPNPLNACVVSVLLPTLPLPSDLTPSAEVKQLLTPALFIFTPVYPLQTLFLTRK